MPSAIPGRENHEKKAFITICSETASKRKC
jgi:hypothetical protein